VVVGNQGGDTQRLGPGDTIQAGDAVIDRDDEVRCLFGGQIDDGRGEAVAEFEPVGQQEIDLGAEGAQGTDADSRGGAPSQS